jgi:murein DD-endopeptidase MepM/ murein hydrolase activator NlpD
MVRRPEVTVGQQVLVNQVIGFVGTSGHSTGPHVHFEVHFGTSRATRLNAIDPAEFMRRAGAPIV